MGYRSDVAIKCEEKAFEELKKIIVDAGKNTYAEPDYIYKESKEDNPNNECDQYILHWEQIEWYNDETIEQIMNKLRELDDRSEEVGYGYKYIRLGEDIDDVSTKTNDYTLVLSIQIHIPEYLKEISLTE